jgi:HAD superfamily hydrolase (TIGR01490 family)
VDGTLDIHAMHRASLPPLAHKTAAELGEWAAEFEQHIGTKLPAPLRAMVQRHLDDGDLCAIVTATTRLIAEPLARLFGLQHLVATEAELHDGVFTGEITGEPCFREHKPGRVRAWQAQQGLRLEAFEESRFYSDSASDLPLLTSVTHPVAVDPDERLLGHALASGWPVLKPDAA